MSRRLLWASLPALVLGLAAVAAAADAPSGLTEVGKPDIKSAGQLAFGPKGVLFVGDAQGGQIFAIGVSGATGEPIGPSFKLENVNAKIAGLLGTAPDEVVINDVAVEPGTNLAYVSVARGKGPTAEPAIVRIDGKGNATALPLDKVQYAKIGLTSVPDANAPAGKGGKGGTPRQQAITDLAFVDGKLFVAGLSNEEFKSALRSIAFPFKEETTAGIEIFHTNHNRVETASPVRTFVPFNVGGEPQLLAAYTCTPLVAISVSSLKPGAKVHGKTVAELGNQNQPLDMIVYEKEGKQFLLLSNSSRGVMKISTDSLDKQPALTEKVSGTAGLKYDTIDSLKGVQQLDKLGNSNALVLANGTLSAVPLP